MFLYGNARVKAVRVVAYGENQRQQLLFGFLRGTKAVDLNTAWGEMYAAGQGIEFLINDGCRGFDQNLRLLSGTPVQLIEDGVEALPPLLFEMRGIPCSQAPEMGDDILFGSQAVPAEPVVHERLQDLLGTAAADAEHELNG